MATETQAPTGGAPTQPPSVPATANALPGAFRGWPYVGETFDVLRDPYGFAKSHADRYGPVFKIRFTGMKTAVLLGPEAHQFVLVSNQKSFSNHQGYSFLESVLGKSVIMLDGQEHTAQRKLVTPAFHGRHMPTYLERINRSIDRQFDAWGASGQRQFYEEARNITFVLSSSMFLGVEVGAEYDRLSHLWSDFSEGSNMPVRVEIPGTKYARAMRAKRELDQLFLRIIAERRAQMAQGETTMTDATGLLLQARDEDGAQLSEAQLLDQMRLLFWAGYDTSSGTAAWVVTELLRNPAALARVRAEVGADGPGAISAPLTMDDIRQKPYLDAVISETLRLHPQVFCMIRGVRETVTFAGQTIPAGWSVMLIPAYSQRMPDIFANPDAFEPERFMPPRDEDKAHPYAWIGFGGGPHICLGEGIAKIEIKAMVTQLLRRYDLTLDPNQDLTPIYMPQSRPKGGVAISYTSR